MELDMNLVVALDALLRENSVTAAAEALHTSAPAMSRTLARLRRVLDDPLLVRAGRTLVPTPRAQELRPEVRALVERARAVFAPPQDLDPSTVERSFAIQTSDALLSMVAAPLIADLRRHAPGITLRFRPESMEDTPALREGTIDLELGVIDHTDPEILTESLSTSTMSGVVRASHPLAKGRVTARRFADADHVVVSRRGRTRGPIDDRLEDLGLSRRVVAVVPTYSASMFLARDTDVVCLAACRIGAEWIEALGLRTIEIPLDLPPVVVGMAWHPRNDADRVHRWLRDRVRAVLAD
ncbi:LysR family transcriptional regulator [Amycolatopsis sp. NPDC059657]|uniref:LysR family transcriptional regulator n=1 Tax=Amycolatopsis sp. NPDC059657 TaxID=3346899 RepID=UPI003670BB29